MKRICRIFTRFVTICLIFVSMAVSHISCVHEFPETSDTSPVKLTLIHELSWSRFEYLYPTRSAEEHDVSHTVRYVIRAFLKDSSSGQPIEFVRFHADTSLNPFITEIDLPPGVWDIYVWSDYVQGERAYHEVSDFGRISHSLPYVGDTDWRDAFEGKTTVAVNASYDVGYCVNSEISLSRPTAKYVFISTDFRKFYNDNLREIAETRGAKASTWSSLDAEERMELLKGYTVTAYYPLFMPFVYDMFNSKVISSERGMRYMAHINPLSDEEAQIALDYVFVNHHDTSAQVQMVLNDPSGGDITMTPTVTVPLRRGQITYVRGNFLTTDIGGGIDIDFEFSGDINIPV